jgi:Zn-dependent protease with chaperone function
MRPPTSSAWIWGGEVTWRARCFDGQRSTAYAVTVTLDAQLLRIHAAVHDGSGPPPLAEVPAEKLSVSERFQAVPRMIGLPGGGCLQVEDDAAGGFDRALGQSGHGPGLVYRIISQWRYVVACIVLLVGVVVWVDRQGAGLMASLVVPLVPGSVDERLGRSALALADSRWLVSSRQPTARRRALEERFMRLVHEQYPQLRCQLGFRGTRLGGNSEFNAFAVPGGTIILLDGLVDSMNDEEVLAVLGHELGHVVHRHGMRGAAQQMGLLAVAGVVWGDVSSLTASVAAGFQGLRYSRAMEADADAFAVTFLRRGGIPVRRLADAFAVIERKEKSSGAAQSFLSDHPATLERLRAAEEAAGERASQASSAGTR